ncbi:MAG: PKD domain-containing protein [Bacteroidia bacterium]|jgi:hypothetical protein
MKIVYTSVLVVALGLSGRAQNDNARVTALIESSKMEYNAGTFMTMESVRHGHIAGLNGVEVKVEQPICADQSGSVLMKNPNNEPWSYKVIDRRGPMITQGDNLGNRHIGNLKVGEYLIHFTHANGTSVIDQFQVKQGKGFEVEVLSAENLETIPGQEVNFKVSAPGAKEISWDFGDGLYASGSGDAAHSFLYPGIYSVLMTASNFDCKTEKTFTVTVSPAAGLAETKD